MDDEGRPGGAEPPTAESAAEPPTAESATEPAPDSAEDGPPISRRLGAVRRAAEAASDAITEAVEAGERLVPRSRARARRALARRRPQPLPNLFELHPEARIASRREVGLKTIPVSEIRGTAVEGGAQRGPDFLPLPQLRGQNWEDRWRRIRAARDRLVILPPIEVLQTGEGYWVVDGHNRVAAALDGGQDDIDAVVTHVHLPGEVEPDVTTGSLAAMLADGDELRAAGAGLLTPGSSLESRRAGRGARRLAGASEERVPPVETGGHGETEQPGQ